MGLRTIHEFANVQFGLHLLFLLRFPRHQVRLKKCFSYGSTTKTRAQTFQQGGCQCMASTVVIKEDDAESVER